MTATPRSLYISPFLLLAFGAAALGQTNVPPQKADGSGGQIKEVTVVNTPAVTVANSPTMQLAPGTSVGISGIASVRVTGTAAVQLVSTPANPLLVRDISTPSRTAFQAEGVINLTNGVTGTPGVTLANAVMPVPPGKRLVIEYASAFGGAPLGQKLFFFINIGGVNHYLPATTTENQVQALFTTGQTVKLYSDASGYVFPTVLRDQGTGSANVGFSISGYLEDQQ
jgi:hypothetical protein